MFTVRAVFMGVYCTALYESTLRSKSLPVKVQALTGSCKMTPGPKSAVSSDAICRYEKRLLRNLVDDSNLHRSFVCFSQSAPVISFKCRQILNK